MKRYLIAAMSLIIASSISFSAFAAGLATTPAGPEAVPTKKHGPCKTVAEACKAAGFVRGKEAPAGKRLFANCMKPLMAGQSVAGVTVNPADVQACKARLAERKKS